MSRFILLGITLALGACAHEHAGEATTTAVTLPPQSAAPVPAPQAELDVPLTPEPSDRGALIDGRISNAIYAGLLSDPALAATAQEVDITARNGRVTLEGRVYTEHERTELELKASNTPGVTSVDNRVRVIR